MKSLSNFCQIFNKNLNQEQIQWYIQQIHSGRMIYFRENSNDEILLKKCGSEQFERNDIFVLKQYSSLSKNIHVAFYFSIRNEYF